jgi:phosphoglycolate phosphatase
VTQNPSKPRLVIFDVDGVLVDSLAAHLQICRDKNEEYGLGLTIPDASAFRELVRRGTRISPMKNLFIALGLPEKYAEKATEDYRHSFRDKYPSRMFPGADTMLKNLRAANCELGIVTGNVKANIVATLGRTLELFRADCVITEDELAGAPKSDGLIKAMNAAHVSREETVFVGDQPADSDAARTTGVNFLGVTYGWGITQEDRTSYPVAVSVSEISDCILNPSFCSRIDS